MYRQADPVVGAAVLREVIGAYLLATVPCSHLTGAVGVDGVLLLLLLLGQHINKTSSAIRVTHIPTGTVVECQNERSQFQNKDKALEILRSRLLAQKQKQQQDAINASRQGQVGTGDRSEKIRTYNFPQDRCTDHRIGLTVHNLSKIMDGNLDELIDALATREQAEKLQKLNEQG